MSLVLDPIAETADNYHVLHGELQVGQLYKRKAAIRPEAQWLGSQWRAGSGSGRDSR
jgi:hypothetical protein